MATRTGSTRRTSAFSAISSGAQPSPTISSVVVTDSNYVELDDTAVGTTGGYIKIKGYGFVANSNVYFNGATITNTYVSSTEYRAVIPATTANTYTLMVFKGASSGAIYYSGIATSGFPSFTSTSYTNTGTDVSIQLLATGDAPLTYTLYSGALPSGVSLAANGLISGTITGSSTNTVTLLVNDGQNQTTQQDITITLTGTDLYFNSTVLLMNSESSGNTFINDASNNAFEISTVGTFRPYKFNPHTLGYYSCYFDGTGDYITSSNTSSVSMGSGDFTIEFWMNVLSSTDPQRIVNSWDTSTVSWAAWEVGCNGTTVFFDVSAAGASAAVNINTATITRGVWYHVACVRNGNVFTIYINGTASATATASVTLQAANRVTIGARNSGSTYQEFFNGWLSNLRITKSAVYTANFTPSSTTTLTAIANTQLLACQANRFIDTSNVASTLTPNADVAIAAAHPFTPNTTYSLYGSTYFDGSTNYLSVPDSTGFDFGSGDFTVEAWIYRASGSNRTGSCVLAQSISGASSNSATFFGAGSDGLSIYLSTSGTAWTNNIETGVAPTNNSWSHAVWQRRSNTLEIYLNGTLQTVVSGTAAFSGTVYNSSRAVTIGSQSGGAFFTGYISNLKVTKGVALYSATFTPSSTPFTADANTQLLTCQTNLAATSKAIVDGSNYDSTITVSGNTAIGSFSPYSLTGWSNYFDGNGDYLTIASNTNFAIASGDNYTIEAWVNYNGNAAGAIFQTDTNISSTTSTLWVGYSGGLIYVSKHGAGQGTQLTYAWTPSAERWYHIAVSRNSGTLRLFVDGALANTVSDSTTYSQSGVAIGVITTPTYMTGYISNLRFIKGTGLYTAAFTPSITPLTAVANTILLTCQSNRFIDNSNNAYSITVNGDTSVKPFSPFAPTSDYAANTVGTSLYFDGTGDFITSSYSINWSTFGSYTMEFWVYHTTLSGTNQTYASTGDTGYTNFYIYTDGRIGVGIQGTNEIASTAGAMTANRWNHVAYTYDGTTTRIFVNGTSVASGTTAVYSNNSASLRIGQGLSGLPIAGYIADFRLTRGQARYTAAFSVPTSPVTLTSNNTIALFNQSPGVVDYSGRSIIETLGDSKASQAIEKFGTRSLYFDGTGDLMIIRNDPLFNFSKGDFTIEFWIYRSATGDFMPVAKTISGQFGSWYMEFTSATSTLKWNSSTTGASNDMFNGVSMGTLPSLSTWYHVAMVRYGSAFTGYINGTGTSVGTSAGTIYNSSYDLTIGALKGSASYNLNGYIDDLRITKYARYVGNFSVPTSPFLTR